MLPSFQGVSAKKGGQTVAKNKKGKKHKKKNFKKVVLTIVSIVEDVVAILIAIKTLLIVSSKCLTLIKEGIPFLD